MRAQFLPASWVLVDQSVMALLLFILLYARLWAMAMAMLGYGLDFQNVLEALFQLIEVK